MKCWITGSRGFIGSNCVQYFKSHTSWHIVTEPEKGIDFIVHLAAAADPVAANNDPCGQIQRSVDATLEVMNYAINNEIKGIIQVSTVEVYGPNDNAVEENTELNPVSPYAVGKAAQELIAFGIGLSKNIPVLVANTANVFGPNQQSEKFLPAILRAADAGLPIPVAEGSRRWIFVDDLSRAFIFLIENAELWAGEEYPRRHITSRLSISNNEFVNVVGEIIGKEIKTTPYTNPRAGHVGNYELAGNKLWAEGWEPSATLDEAIVQSVAWYRANPSKLKLPNAY